jgi:hypothetical protein
VRADRSRGNNRNARNISPPAQLKNDDDYKTDGRSETGSPHANEFVTGTPKWGEELQESTETIHDGDGDGSTFSGSGHSNDGSEDDGDDDSDDDDDDHDGDDHQS